MRRGWEGKWGGRLKREGKWGEAGGRVSGWGGGQEGKWMGRGRPGG